MSDKKSIVYITAAFLILISTFILYHIHYQKKNIEETEVYLNDIYKIERSFIENIPIIDDFTSPEKENKLRRHLLNDHIKAAVKFGIPPIRDNEETDALYKSGKLIKVESGADKQFYFYNVRDDYRYLTPDAAAGLDLLADRFQKNIQKRILSPIVKIAVSSAVRPADYQKGLTRKNFNASIESTHCYGTSFDIFYDDYYVTLPEPTSDNSTAKKIEETLRRRFGFLIGDALRREFHSVLMETLIELQEEGIIYAILEKKQRCYHVTVLKRN
jgi:hypothetical protein